MSNLLSDLERKYHELLNPVSQGLSNIGKGLSQAGSNAIRSAQQLPTIIGQDIGLLGDQIRPIIHSPQLSQQLPSIIGQGLQQANKQVYGNNLLSSTLNNFVVPGISNTAGALTTAFTNKNPLQKTFDVAKGVGSVAMPGQAVVGGLFSGGMNALDNLTKGNPLTQNAGNAIKQGYDFGAALGPIGKVVEGAGAPIISRSGQLAPKLIDNPYFNKLGDSTLKTVAKNYLGKAGASVVKEGLTGAAYTGLEGGNPIQGAINFAPYGLLHGFGKAEETKTNLKGVNPKAFSMHPEDLADAKNAIDTLRYLKDSKPEDKQYALKTVQNLLDAYIPGHKYSNTKKALDALEYIVQANDKLPNVERTPFPSMGFVENGEFKPPYKKGDISKLQRGIKDELSTIQRTDPKQSRLQELEYYAKQGNEEAKAQLDLIQSMQKEVERAKAAKLGNVAQQPLSDIGKAIDTTKKGIVQAGNTYADLHGVSPDSTITVYRGVKSSYYKPLAGGEWVTQDKQLANLYARNRARTGGESAKIISQKVKASDLVIDPSTNPGVENEFRYNPSSPQQPLGGVNAVSTVHTNPTEQQISPKTPVTYEDINTPKAEIPVEQDPVAMIQEDMKKAIAKEEPVASKFRKIDPFEAEMDAQVGKPVELKPRQRSQTTLNKDIPQYTQADSNFEAGRSQMGAAENKKRFDELFAKWVGKRDAAQTSGTQLGSTFKSIPKSKFRSFARKVENGQETKLSGDLRTELDRIYGDAKENGIEMGYRENYLPHVWDKAQNQVAQDYKIFKKREGFQNDRVLPTYEEGIRMGLKPKYKTVGELLADYGTRVERLKANLNFFKQLKDEGFIVDASVGSSQPGFMALDGPGFPRSISRGIDGQKIVGNYYAPEDVAKKINKIFSPDEGNKYLNVSRKVSSVVQDVTLSGGIPGTPLNAFTLAQAQKEILAGRIKSPVASFIRSLSPGKSLEFFEKNAEQIKKMQENNIPITSSFNIGEIVSGGDKGNLWNRAVNDPTFKRFMPQLQINLFNDIEKQALKGGRTPEEATRIASQAVKSFYGVTGTNKSILEGALSRQTKGTFLFAPKFRESMINFWINNVKALKNPTALENRANIKFMAGSILTLGAMDFLNKQLNGNHMWQNPPGKEDKLLIPTGNGDVIGIPFLSSIATLPRGIVREGGMLARGDISGAAVDAGQTYLSSLVKPFFDVAKNSDYFGKEIVSESDTAGQKLLKQGAYVGNQFLGHPYIKEFTDPRNAGDPLYQRVSRMTELPLRFYTEDSLAKGKFYDEYYKLKPISEQYDKLSYQDPIQAQKYYDQNKEKLDRFTELKAYQKGYYDSGQNIDLLKQPYSSSGKAFASDGGGEMKNNFLIGKNGKYVDLNPPTKGNGIGAFTNSNWNITKAREIWNSEDFTTEQKNAAFKKLNVNAEDVRYDALANYSNDIKTQYLLSKSQDRQTLFNNLLTGRKKSIGGNIFASDGVITNLVDQGILTKAEGAAFKKIDYNKDGTRVASSGGRKIKVPKVKAISIKLPSARSLKKVSLPKQTKVKEYRLTKVGKLKTKVKKIKKLKA